MLKGKTSTGFAYSVDDEARDDYDLMIAFQKIDSGATEEIDAALELLLGKAQKNKLREHCKGKTGRVLASKMTSEIEEIINGLAQNPETKNS